MRSQSVRDALGRPALGHAAEVDARRQTSALPVDIQLNRSPVGRGFGHARDDVRADLLEATVVARAHQGIEHQRVVQATAQSRAVLGRP